MRARNKGDFSIAGKGLPKAPFRLIAETVLGKSYALSVVAASPMLAKNLNKKYRNKTYVPDVLAFPLGKNEGEIVLNKNALKREAKKHGLTPEEFAAYIFMHACIHLTGLTHGKTMTTREAHFAKKLKIKAPVTDKEVL